MKGKFPILVAFLTALLSITAVQAQLNISCSTRQLCSWNGYKATDCETSSENSMFKINADETMFEHTTPTISSAYYIKSKKKSGDVWTLKVTSDVGNEYTFTLDLPGSEVRATGKAVGEGSVVKFLIKRHWTEDGAGAAEEPAVVEKGGDKNGPCPSGASSSTFSKGDAVKIAGISLDDSYLHDADNLVGMSAIVGTEFEHETDCWYSGNLVCADGTTRYFFRVAVKGAGSGSGKKLAASSGSDGTCPSQAYHEGEIPKGTKVQIAAVSKEDAYFSDRSGIEGKSCTVGADFNMKSDCWYAGNLIFADGTSKYFYRVAVTKDGATTSGGTTGQASTCPSDAVRDRTFSKGTKVIVVGISDKDSFYEDSPKLVGKTYLVDDDFTYQEDCYYSGNLKPMDGGSNYYFYRVAIKPAK